MKRHLRGTLTILAALAAATLIFLLALPYILDSFLLPRLLGQLDLPHKSVSISRLTPYGLRGSLEFEGHDAPVVSVPRFELTYTPRSLLKRRLNSIVIDQAILHLRLQDGRIEVAGIEPDPRKKSTAGQRSLFLLPFAAENLVLKQVSLIVHEPGQPDLRLGLSARATLTYDSGAGSTYQLDGLQGSFVLTDAVSATGSLSMNRQPETVALDVSLQDGRLPGLDRFLPAGIDSTELGDISGRLSLRLDSKSAALTQLSGTGTLAGFTPELTAVAARGAATGDALQFSFSGSPAALTYSISSLQLTRPLRLEASLAGSLNLVADKLHTSGNIEASAVLDGAAGTAAVPLHLSYTADFASERLEAQITSKASLPQAATTAGIEIPAAVLQAQIIRENGLTSGTLTGSVPELLYGAGNLHVSGISFELPFQFPVAAPAPAGRFTIEAVGHGGTDLLRFAGGMELQGERLIVNGAAEAPFKTDFTIDFTGSAEPLSRSAELAWSLPAVDIDSFSLPPLEFIPATLTFAATISAKGNLSLAAGGISGELRTSINQALVSFPEKEIELQDVDCTLELPQLPQLVSSPSQLCTAGSIAIGKLQFTDAAVTYRIENQTTLFIEKSSAGWAQGTVESGSLRLSTTEPEIDTTLYCSRINFAELLKQFGLDQTEGEGALNGKLPIQLSEEGLQFDDGFLFSTPGTGGIVRFTDTDVLRQGMGSVADTGYLSYTMQALENFAYDWTRISFDTEGDELLLALTLEGEPQTPLPYSFRNGSIVQSSEGEGLQYPIHLNVNFRLPLAQLFQVGQNIKTMMENR